MATFTWFGGSGIFTNASDWSPNGVPGAGSTAIFSQGTLQIDSQYLANVTFNQGGNPNFATILDLHDVLLGKVNLDSTPGGSVPGNQTMNVSGFSAFTGPITDIPNLSGDQLTINQAAQSVLLNTNLIGLVQPSQEGALIDVTAGAGATLVNFGEIAVEAPSGGITITPNIVGVGTIELGGVTGFGFITAEFGAAVGAGQTFQFSADFDAASSNVRLLLDDPSKFHATIADFTSSDEIELKNTTVTSESFNNGVLTLNDGPATVANLRFAGSNSLSSFVIQPLGADTLIKHV